MANREQVAASVAEMEPLSNFLMPYSSYEHDPGVFFLSDFSIGMAWELTPRASSHLSAEQKDQIAKRIASTFSRIDDYTSIQFIAMPSAIVDDEIENFKSQGGTSHNLMSKIHASKAEFFQNGVHGLNVPIGDIEFRTKKIRIIVTLVVRAAEASTGATSALADAIRRKVKRNNKDENKESDFPALDRFQEDFGKLHRQLMKNSMQLEGVFKSNGMFLKRLDTKRFITYLRNQIQMNTGPRDKVVFDPTVPINEQALNKEVRYDQDKGSVYCDGMHHRLLSVASFPDSVHTGLLSEPNENLGFFSLFDYITNGIMVINIYAKPRGIVAAELEKRISVASKGMGNPMKRDQILADLKLAQQWTIQESRRLLEVSVTMSMAHEDPKVAGARIEMLQAKLAEIGFRSRIEETPAPSLWMQQLPFGYKPSAPEARRSRPLVDLAVADLLPIYVMGRGTKSNTMMSFNRLGEPFGWDMFDSSSGYHMAIFGQSGSGKSFQINSMCCDFLANDNRKVFLIDKGRSYVQTVGLFGDAGQFCNITMREKTCINVFAGTYTMAGAFLGAWLPYLCERSESDKLDQETFGMLEEKLRVTYNKKKDFDVPYRFRSDLAEIYDLDKSAWIDLMRKRFLAEPKDDFSLTELNALKEGDAANIPVFDIFFKVRILGRTRDVLTSEANHVKEAIAEARAGREPVDFRINPEDEYSKLVPANVTVDTNEGHYNWKAAGAEYKVSLSDRQLVLTEPKKLEDLWPADIGSLRRSYPYVECDEEGVYILAGAKNAARALQSDGWVTRLVDDYLVVEAAERKDIQALISNGLVVRLPADYIERNRAKVTKEVKAEFGEHAEKARIEEYVEDKLRRLDPADYFDELEGKAIIQKEVFFRDLAEMLEQDPAQEMQKLLRQLGPYNGSGVYAGFFDGATQFDLTTKRIICWECGELFSAGEHLVGAVLGAIFQLINVYSQSASGGKYQKLCVIDEFFEFNKSPIVTDFVETTLRQGRKHNLAQAVATQSVTDLAEGPARKLLELIQFTIIGMQKAEVVARLGDLLRFTPEQAYLASSCITDKGVFSEFMLVNNDMGLCEVQRIVTPPLLYWAFTSDSKDKTYREEKRREFQLGGMDTEDSLVAALVHCSKEYPKGVARGQRVVI